MNVFSVTPAYNEDSYLEKWISYYNIYKSEIKKHIIVDNNSKKDYKIKLYKSFPESIIIEREKNGGVTAAFNDGIRYAIENKADAILLITQDIRLKNYSISQMLKYFEYDSRVGIVGPILLRPDGVTIEEYGGKLNYDTFKVHKLYVGKLLDDSIPDNLYVDFIAGGICLIKTEVFKDIGYQDESLFMYGDETDFNYRALKKGWKLLVTKKSIAYHIHNGVKSSLKPKNLYYMTRNNFILINKHNGKKKLFLYIIFSILKSPRLIAHYIKRKRLDLALSYLIGIISGATLGLIRRKCK